MALYTYRALDSRGKIERGSLNAASQKEAMAALQSRHIFPVEIKSSGETGLGLSALFSRARGPRLSVQHLAAFVRQFATLLEATIPYDSALELILQQTNEQAFKAVLSDVRGRVVEGAYLADAFSRYPRVFPPMVVNMVRSGETSGTLPMIMHRLADYYDNLSRLRSKLNSALVYPLFMMVIGAAVVTFMITFIIPKITRLFDNFGVTLPLPTRILIGTSQVIGSYWWLILALGGLAVWGGVRFLRTERGRLFRDTLELSIPFWKHLRRKIILQRLVQTLSTLLRSGVELNEALRVSSEVMGNKLYQEAIERVIFDVQNKGLSLSVALRRTAMFPEDICRMISIGEETAMLEAMLDNVSVRLSSEVIAETDAATSLFEPTLILIMGAAVGFIVVSILLPMLQLNQLVG